MVSDLTNQTDVLDDDLLSGIPVDSDILFSNHKGVYKKRTEKRQTGLLENIQFIEPFLWEGERILQVTIGCSPMSLLEQIVTGWIVFSLKRSFLIFTNKRIFHVPIKSKGFLLRKYVYRNSIAQILYADCESITQRGRTLVVRYKSGKKERFFHIAGKEKKKIKVLLKTMTLEGRQSQTMERTFLCPRCTSELIKNEYICPYCELVFKSKSEARKISIIYPGGGYFYTRHPFLGISDAFVELILMSCLISAVIDVINNVDGASSYLVTVAIFLTFEKLITIYHSNHFINEYIPVEKEIEPFGPESEGSYTTVL